MSKEKSVEELTLYDPKLLKRVMGASTEAMEVILNSILETTVEKSDFEVLEVLTKKISSEKYGDVMQYIAFCQDSSGEDYEIEVQLIGGEDAYNRTMVYLSTMFGRRMSMRFSGYTTPKSYVIIINKEDMIGYNEPYYLWEMRGRDVETDQPISPEIERLLGLENCFPLSIFINGSYTDNSTPLGRLLADFEESNPDEFIFPALAESVKAAKDSIIE